MGVAKIHVVVMFSVR